MASLMWLQFQPMLVVRLPRAEERTILVFKKMVALVLRWLLSEPISAPPSLYAGWHAYRAPMHASNSSQLAAASGVSVAVVSVVSSVRHSVAARSANGYANGVRGALSSNLHTQHMRGEDD